MIALMVAALPNVFLAILGKLVTQKFMQSVLEMVIIASLRKAVSMTTNTVDDALVEDVAAQLIKPGE